MTAHMRWAVVAAAALLRRPPAAHVEPGKAPWAANGTASRVAGTVSLASCDTGCCDENVQCPGKLDCQKRPYVCKERERRLGDPFGANRRYWFNPILQEKLGEACAEAGGTFLEQKVGTGSQDGSRVCQLGSELIDAAELPFFLYPQHWYTKVRKIAEETPKRTKFCFMGSSTPCRTWVPVFAKAFFGQEDFLGFTDKDFAYKPLGSFDVTKHYDGHRPQDFEVSGLMTEAEKASARAQKNFFDADYFRGLAECEYALAPRGMEPYSMRFYEALAAGAIPVLRSPLDQRRSPDEAALVDSGVYQYISLAETGSTDLASADLFSADAYAHAVARNLRVFEERHLLRVGGANATL